MNNIAILLGNIRSGTDMIEKHITDLRHNILSDLKPVQHNVDILCKQATQARLQSPEQKQELQDAMAIMITRLDELEAELTLYRQRKMDERNAPWSS